MDISASSIAREFKAPKGVSIAQYGANYYHDTGKSILQSLVLFFTAGRILLSENVDSDKHRQNNLSEVNDSIFTKLQSLKKENKCEVTVKNLKITLEKQGSRVKITVNNRGEISTDFVDNMDFVSMQDIILSGTSIDRDNLKTHPEKVIAQLRHLYRTLPPVPFDVDINNKVLPKIEEQACPGGHNSVKIFAETTFHGLNAKEQNAISDSATVVFFDDTCVVTMVDGCNFTAKPENSRTYSALITAAALDTVQSFKNEEISDKYVQKYFYNKVKEFEQITSFIRDDDRGVTFAGVVFFRNGEGKKMQLTYGLGDTALASTKDDGTVSTHHLQGDFAFRSEFESTIPALGPGYRRITEKHVTVKISPIDENTATVQLMTDGSELAHYNSLSEVKGDVDKPGVLFCNNTLPNHGKFSAGELTKLANPEELTKAEKIRNAAFASYNTAMQSEDDIVNWNSQLKSEDDSAYRKLATSEGREKNKKYFNEKNPMPSKRQVKDAMQRQDTHWEPCIKAAAQATSAKGDDVLHLSINVREAFAEMDSRTKKYTTLNTIASDARRDQVVGIRQFNFEPGLHQDINENTTIDTIRGKVAKEKGVTVDKVRLYNAGRQLEDGRSFADYGLQKGDNRITVRIG